MHWGHETQGLLLLLGAEYGSYPDVFVEGKGDPMMVLLVMAPELGFFFFFFFFFIS